MNGSKMLGLVVSLLLSLALAGEAQVPSQFNYQGKLMNGTNLVNASTTMVFRLYNAALAGDMVYAETQTVTVVDGLYSAQVGTSPSFGTLAAAVTNQPLYLELQVGATTLTPREQVLSVMYAFRAAGVTNGAITTAMLANSAVTGAKIANNTITGGKIVVGAVSNSHLAAASVTINKIDWTQMPAGLEDGDDGEDLLSYTENGAFAVTPVATGVDSIAQGLSALVESDYSVIGGGETNRVASSAPHSVIAGGNRNLVNVNADHAVIAGGRQNEIANGAMRSFIGGGYLNRILNTAYYSTIPGGNQNSIGINARQATIGGGYKNVIAANSTNTVIAGGAENVITNAALYAAIPGGDRNTAGGEASFAAGRRAKATNDGTFVWADHTDADFGSTKAQQFLIRASGGVGINTNLTPEALTVAGRVKADGFIGDGSGLANLSGGALVAGTVSNVHLANNAVTGSKIAAATITFTDMAQNGAANGQVMKWNGSAWVAADDVGTSSPLASYSENGAFSPLSHAYAADSIAQGCANGIFSGSDFSVIGGGLANAIADNSPQSTIGGGRMNAIFQNTTNATIGGGFYNEIYTFSDGATIGGGETNWIRSSASHSVIAGGWGNGIGEGSGLAAVGGGSGNRIGSSSFVSVIAGGSGNSVSNDSPFAAIGGGDHNRVGWQAEYVSIGGGYMNEVSNLADSTAIGGGRNNLIGNNADYAAIAGGQDNTISSEAKHAAIAGGKNNAISSDAKYAAIAGGHGNSVSGYYAVALGGYGNVAAGSASAAAGNRAKATNDGTFVWADSTEADFSSTSDDQFLIRAGRGVGINTNVTPEALTVAGRVKADGFLGNGSGLTNLSGGSIMAGTISNLHIAAGAVTGTKIANATITSDKIANATITFTNMAQNGAANGQVMKWSGSAWVAANDTDGTLASYAEGFGFDPAPSALGSGCIAQGTGARASSDHSVVGGGLNNSNFAAIATIAGGEANKIEENCNGSSISGGGNNRITKSFLGTLVGTIGGGYSNVISYPGHYATIAGGQHNSIAGMNAMIPGGVSNAASGNAAFAAGYRAKATNDGCFVWADNTDADFFSTGSKQFLIRASGGVGIGTNNPQSALDVAGATRTTVLEITGGSDLSEKFDIRGTDGQRAEPGMLVSINPACPGELVISGEPYDRRVAGVISGAGGINPGMLMGQQGSHADGNTPVALSGRVYCWADAFSGPIQPGDLLTTSGNPGHAMCATDHVRAQGAIIGKAMTSLREGQGLVLVLVALQ